MNTNIKKLVELITKHPDREVIAMVDHEVVWDDGYSRWIGRIGDVRIDEYYWTDFDIYFKSKNTEELKEDYLDMAYDNYKHECFTDDDWDRLGDEYIDGLEWIEAIVVNIDTH